jgi:tRNA1Val (adenine37-N6)-methyltransferase
MSARFRGWTRPGPLPPGATGDVVDDDGRPVVVEPGETLDWLAGHYRIFQYEQGHRFSVDDVLCAWFATSHAPRVDRALDLGSGIGSVAMTVAWRLPGCAMATIEAQEISLRLARKSLAYNGLRGRVTPYLGDLRDDALVDGIVGRHGPFDLVTGSPPYWPVGAALPSVHAQAVPARLEVRGDVGDYARAAARALAPGGVFALVHQASQHERVLAALSAAALVPLFVRLVRFKEDAPPSASGIGLYVAARAVDVPRGYADGRPGKPVVAPDLVLRRRDGGVHPEYATIRLTYGFPPGDADPDER